MPARRLVPHVLLALCSALAIAQPARAGVTAAWIGGDIPLHSPSQQGGGSKAIADADGNVYAYWIGQGADMGMRLLVARRAAGSSSWGAPVEVGSAGALFNFPSAVLNPDGDLTVAWTHNDGDSSDVETATIDTADGSWNGQTDRVETPHGNAQDATLIADGAGTQTLIWADNGDITVSRRPAGGGWSAPQAISGSLTGQGAIAVAGPGGDVVAFWGRNGTEAFGTSVYDGAAGTWSEPASTPFTGDVVFPRLIADGRGGYAVTWFDPDNYPASAEVKVLRMAAGATTWGATEILNQPGVFAATPDIAALPGGDLYAIWTEMDFGTGVMSIKARTWSRASGDWGAEEVVREPAVGGYAGARISSRPNGDLVGAVVHYTGPNPLLAVWARDHETGAWSQPEDLPDTALAVNTVPVLATDEDGNALVSWDEQPASDRSAHTAVADAAGPRLRDLSVPAAGTTGAPLSVSLSASDVWSDVASTTIDFGDGTTAGGTTAVHAYTAAGTYTITVTSADTLGNTTEARRTLTVSDPPAPPSDDEGGDTPKPPVVIAPVIEARLAGKTVTVNAKVTLKAGQKCKGTITVTTAFGGKTYKAPAKLALKNGACRATAQITLKKTPSLRTKLRVTVGATKADKKKITTRTITSRRG